MPVSRLTETQKESLVEGFRVGKSVSILAKEFGCSPNTVTRIVKTVIPLEEYNFLKASRVKRRISKTEKAAKNNLDQKHENLLESIEGSSEKDVSNHSQGSSLSNEEVTIKNESIIFKNNESGPLALDDADDFCDDLEEDESSGDSDLLDNSSLNIFHEVVPLSTEFDLTEKVIDCVNFSEEDIPNTVYILVDRSSELDVRLVKDFFEFGMLSESDTELKGIYLFSNQRSAKRECGRNYRVIKVPNSSIFKLVIPFLLEKGITRLIIDGSLMSIDH